MRKNRYNPLFDCGNLFGDIFEGEQLQLDLFVSTADSTRNENANAQSVEQNKTAAETQLYDYSFEYQLLSRLKMDCEYFLNAGNRCEKHLWACNVNAQISKMRELYDLLPEKPEWLTREEIDDYADRMAPPSPFATENFRIRDDCLGQGTAKEKFQRNISAIKLLKKLETSGKQATVRDQEILAKYVGWGGLFDAFDATKTSWAKEYRELKDVLTPEEYAAARASTLASFYTSPTIIKAMYDVLGKLGFTSGNILEPSMGVGNFFGLLPEAMRDSRLYGVELDVISGKIAQYLYPKANITIAGFETTNRKDFYDVAIGNVPFGNYRVNDSAYNKLNFSIHNYFFAKALDQVRPGGIVAFITSRRTMDKKNSEVRKYIAQRADLLGAIRLPNDAFKENAGTKVVSDIIFLQKRDRIITAEPDWIGLSETEDNVLINNYFVQRPEMMLGTPSSESSPYGERVFTLAPIADATLSDLLQEATRHINGEYQSVAISECDNETIQETMPADPNVKNYSYTIVDGAVWYRENSVMVKSDLTGVVEKRVKGMIELRDCVRNLIERQLDFSVSDEAIQEMQTKLNRLYNNYTAEYGLINSRANALAFNDDSSYFLLCSLEELDENKKLKRKADIFNKRTVQPHREATSADSPAEALALSIGERGCVSMPYMSRLCGLSEEEIVRELRSVIFLNPAYENDTKEQQYLTADEYLSGNVRKKLEQAELFAKLFPEKYAVNVEALKKVQPKELSATEIDVRLGATWIDKRYIQQFMEETFRTPFHLCDSIRVDFSERTSEWHVSNKSSVGYDINADVTFGTDRANAYKILEDTLNLRDVRIYDQKATDNGQTKRVLNSKETILAQQKQGLIKDAFREWIWKDLDRREDLVRKYNRIFNSVRPRAYDGQHLILTGMNPEIKLWEHQRNAIARILYGGNTLLAHEVGAGKTFEMVAAAMESKRLGLCNKSLFVVPNHLTEQWASEFLRLYPAANILVTTKKDFEPRNRKTFCARIATGDYDAVIMGHSQFEKIPLSVERQKWILEEQIGELLDAIMEIEDAKEERFTVKQLEKAKKALQVKLEKLMNNDRKDDVVTFEQLGVDRLFVDEAHAFKNLFFTTKMRNVSGLSTSASQKSSDMLIKCRYMDELTGSVGVIFATGTPVMNSMTELYTMMVYLQHDMLEETQLIKFDSWASVFGETVTAIELAPEGTGYRARTRFARFHNLPELMSLFKETADIQTSDQLNLPAPHPVYHTEVAHPTDIQNDMMRELSERAAKIHRGEVDSSEDNMLCVTSDGRKIGLDQRLMNPLLPDDPNSKLNLCVRNVLRIWRETLENRLTQLIFCDFSAPKADASFNVYDDIKAKLIANGVPETEVAFIHDANTEIQKEDLFRKVRTGQVRVLLGSTQKMGAGTNCQDKLIALHDLDAPWRPGDLEQRSGRIIRQGNNNPEVHIYRYVTEATFDAYLWQTLENKQKFIAQIMTSKSPVRTCEDVDETALSYAEIKALCAGDERIKEKMDLDVEVSRLKLVRAEYQSKQYELEDKLLKKYPMQMERDLFFIKGINADIKTLASHPSPTEGFVGMTVQDRFYADKQEAGKALLNARCYLHGYEEAIVGSYRGFKIALHLEALGHRHFLVLKGATDYSVELGESAQGNIVRIDNALADLPKRKQRIYEDLERLRAQMKVAKEELGKPFPKEEEYQKKSARLIELNAELNLDGKKESELAPVDVENVSANRRAA